MKTITPLLNIVLAMLVSFSSFAQSTPTITGTIKSTNNERLIAVSVIVKATGAGTFTDDKGNFRLIGNFSFPLTLVISSVGYASQEITVADAGQTLNVSLTPVVMLAQEVVVSASRLPERILESPVTVERVGTAAIRNNPAPSYYDIVGTLKGVDVVTSSLNYKTPSTRGFNSSGNLRLNQLVDGMDNQAPGLNFAVGSMIGPTELDVESMELLGGASSALYGPGGMNGTLLINSKNPFKYQGLSVQAKEGVMHIADDAHNASAYNDFTLRYAKALSQKFAFKIGGQYIYGKDWVAQDYRNFDIGSNPATGDVKQGNRQSDANYNGINMYGDETTVDLKPVLPTAVPPAVGVIILPTGGFVVIPSSTVINPYIQGSSFFVSRTGYKEPDILDPTTKNLRLTAALHYKFTPSIEGSLSGNFGYGSTVYTGSDRYSLKNFTMGQYKAEVRHKNWFVRAYTTREDAGKSFNATITTRLFNEAWKSSSTAWYPAFIGNLVKGTTQVYSSAYLQAYTQATQAGMSDSAARVAAAMAAANGIVLNQTAILNASRDTADKGMPAVGSAEFKRLFDSVASRAIKDGGGLFLDKSSLNMAEAQYNLSDRIKVAELIVGANFKQYVLNSEGTLFADTAGRIKINEVGAYALVAKKLFKDVLKLTASGRYDKNSNFKGRFTPRISAVVTVAKDHNIRLSFQTAYRFPSTQNQWINLSVGGGTRLIGGLKQLRDYYNFSNNPVYSAESFVDFADAAGAGNVDSSKLQLKTFGEYKPESVKSYEIGYKALIGGKLLVDLYGYYTEYQNFIGRTNVVQSATGSKIDLLNDSFRNVFSVSVNSAEKVNTQGWGVSIEYLLPNNFSVNGNFYSDEIKNVPADFVAYYNTPKYRTNIGLTNSGLFLKKKLGFGIQYHWQDAFRYQNDFVSGTVTAYGTLDAQVSYKLPAIKSLFKLGGSNLTNHYYRSGFGMPSVGALYYASFAYNVF